MGKTWENYRTMGKWKTKENQGKIDRKMEMLPSGKRLQFAMEKSTMLN